jgi:putative chitinase
LSLPVGQQTRAVAAPTRKLTAEQLLKIFPNASKEYMQQVADELNTNLPKYGLDSSLRCAHFFAQAREEGGAALAAKVESMNYAEEGLKSTFKYYREHPTEAKEDGYAKDAKTRKITRHAEEEKIGNKVYANRNGNGGSASGDGWKYRGRGLIQVTGRANYRAAAVQYSKLYGNAVDFEADPDKMAIFPYTVRSAVCFWIEHGLQNLAEAGKTDEHVDGITKVINKDTDSYANRRANFKTALDALSD